MWMQLLGGLGEREAMVVRWRHSSAHVQIATPDAVRVVLSLSTGQRVVHALRERTASALGLPGHVSVFPAGVASDTTVEGAADIVQVFFKPNSFEPNAQGTPSGLPVFESRSESLKQAAISLFVATEHGDRVRRDSAATQLNQIVDAVLAEATSGETIGTTNKVSSLVIERIEQVIEDAMSGSGTIPPSVEELAAAAHLSVSHFIRSVRQTIGTTPHQFVMFRRNERAMDLLREQDRSVSDVANAVGYSSPAHFVASFRERFGVTPGAYQRALQGGLSTSS